MDDMKASSFKKIPKTRVYDAVLPLYDLPFSIYISDDMMKAAKAADTDYPSSDSFEDTITINTMGYAAKLTHPTEGVTFIMLLNAPYEGNSSISSILCHESLHLAEFMLEVVGVKHNPENHEALAYAQQSIFEAGRSAILEYKKRYKFKIEF